MPQSIEICRCRVHQRAAPPALRQSSLRHEQFGQSSERGSLLNQLELQLADLKENTAQAETAAQPALDDSIRCLFDLSTLNDPPASCMPQKRTPRSLKN